MSHDDNNDGSDGLPPEGAIVDPGPEYASRLKLYDVHNCLPKGTSFAIRNACWVELMRLQAEDAVDIYLPAGWGASGFRWFNVWDNRAWERVTLHEWVTRWYADYQAQSSAEGGAE